MTTTYSATTAAAVLNARVWRSNADLIAFGVYHQEPALTLAKELLDKLSVDPETPAGRAIMDLAKSAVYGAEFKEERAALVAGILPRDAFVQTLVIFCEAEC